ncbi:MAG: chloride channel protein, partial [Gammaproteobacteria bacterium]
TIIAAEKEEPVNVRAGLASTLAALLSVGSGGPVGQYGPLIHFGGTVGSWLKRSVGQAIPLSTCIACGVAGAIAAGFGAPVAAIIFAHEVILRRFSIPDAASVSVSAVTATTISSEFLVNDGLHFEPATVGLTAELMPFVLFAAPVFAAAAILFMMLLGFLIKMRTRSATLTVWPFILGALICGAASFFVPDAFGFGLPVISDLLQDKILFQGVCILVLSKVLLTSIFIGSGLHGGIFLPSLFIGAGVGSLLGKIATLLGIAGGAQLGLAGMAAVAAAVFGAPISTVLIVLEFTGSYHATLYSIVAVTVTSLITSSVYAPSFFERKTT